MARSKRSAKTRRPQRETYILRILDWHPSYSFGLTEPKHVAKRGAFEESWMTILDGEIVEPGKFAGLKIEAYIYPSRELVSSIVQGEDCIERQTGNIGTIFLRQKTPLLVCNIPADVSAFVAVLLHSGKAQYLILDSKPEQHGRADIRGLAIDESNRQDEELPKSTGIDNPADDLESLKDPTLPNS